MAGCSQTASVSSAGGETAAVQTQPKLEILEDQDHSDYSRAAEQKIQMHDAADSRLFSSSNLKVTPEKDYTLMVYIVGSNLESRYGAASKDIDEMKTSGFDFEKNNLIVYTGGSKRRRDHDLRPDGEYRGYGCFGNIVGIHQFLYGNISGKALRTDSLGSRRRAVMGLRQ